MSEVDFTNDSVISLQHLTVIEEINEYTIGDEIKNIFFRVPVEAIYVIQKADGVKTIREIEESIKASNQVEVDVLDFINSLNKLGLVETGSKEKSQEIKNNSWTILVGKLLFNKFTTVFYILNVLLLITLFVTNYKASVPSYKDTFVFSHVGLSLLLFFIVSWTLVFIHELAHYFSVASHNKKMKLQLSIRWLWIVVEANMNSLWLIPRKKRYIPFLAGFFWDVVILNIALILGFILEQGIVLSIFKMITLIQFYKILWQFVVFLRTDFYYVIINYLGVSNLTKGSIAFLLRKISKKHDEFFQKFNIREKSICKKYSCFYLLSLATVFYLFFSLSLPATLYAIMESLENINRFNLHTFTFWDSTIVLFIFLLEIVLWGIGGYQRWKRGELKI